MTNKLPPAKDWRNRDIDDWNVVSFTEYLRDKHREQFGIEYAPMRSWRMEQGQIGRLIGTRTKEGTHSKAMVKRFIDEAFASYTPTAKYTGTNFGYIYTNRWNLLQRIEAEASEKKRLKERRESVEEVDYTDLSEWI